MTPLLGPLGAESPQGSPGVLWSPLGSEGSLGPPRTPGPPDPWGLWGPLGPLGAEGVSGGPLVPGALWC